MKKIFSILFTVFILSTATVTAQAAKEGTVKEAESTLETVVITAGREEEKKKEVSQNIDVIDEEEIENSPGDNVGDLLAQKSTGYIKKYPGGLTSVGIRGFKTDTHGNDLRGKVLILLNGRRAGTGNLAKIMSKNIERIEIVRGPSSVQYGSAGIGGVVNIITKQGKEEASVFVEGAGGSNEYQETGFGFAGKEGAFDFTGSFSELSRGDYQTSEGDEYKNTGIDKQVNYSLNLGFSFLTSHRIGLILNGYDANGIGNPDAINQNDFDDYKDSKNESVDLIYTGSSNGSSLSWKARYFSGVDQNINYDPSESNTGRGVDDDKPYENKVDQIGSQVQLLAKYELGSILFGYDWLKYASKETIYFDPDNYSKSDYLNSAPFLLAKLKLLNERIVITAGLRKDEFEVNYSKADQEGKTQKHSNLSRQAGIAFMVGTSTKLRAAYGEGFVVPSAEELSADYGSTPKYSGNPNLKPESSVTQEVGFDASHRSVEVSLTYFSTVFKDKIESYDVSGDEKSWKNLGEASLKGYEGRFTFDIGDLLDWNVELKPYFNFVQYIKYQDEEADEKLTDISNRQYSYGLSFNDQQGLTARLNYAYTGEQVLSYPKGEKKDGFSVADFSLSQKVDFDQSGKLRIKGEVKNLNNQEYEYVVGYPMPGRTYSLGLRYDY